MPRQIRNYGPVPEIEKEGYFVKPLASKVIPHNFIERLKSAVDTEVHDCTENSLIKQRRRKQKELKNSKQVLWSSSLHPWQRLHMHHTLSSVRQSVNFVCDKQPYDELDLILSSSYKHNAELFPDTSDVYLQSDTQGIDTWRLLRNVKFISMVPAVPRRHPIVYGGLKERLSIYSVDLGIAANHMAQTNAGFSRKDNGTFYSV